MTRRLLAALGASALVGALLTLPVLPAHAASTTAVADTYSDASLPTTSLGSPTSLKTDGSPVLVGYLKFDVTDTTVGSATLELYAETGSSKGFDVVRVPNTSWQESTLTAANAPALGAVVASSGPLTAGQRISLDVSAAVTGPGLVSLGLTTSSSTAIRIGSRESGNPPRLTVGPPATPLEFAVNPSGTGFEARSTTTPTVLTGTLKSVVEGAVTALGTTGGTIRFGAGTYDLGSDYFKLTNVHNVSFVGAGMGRTTIQNDNSSAADTEPFNFTGAFGVRVSDLTVRAGGARRNTSDALDFDRGNDVVVSNVAVTQSRGRGIVFDGKNTGWDSANNRVTGCLISGVPSDGIELLASVNNVVENCTITDVGGHGIQIAKASATADQPNKKSSGNTITGNTIDQAGLDGINVNGGDRNVFANNTIYNSSDDTTSRDGIRLGTSDAVSCDDNQIRGNRLGDNQATPTQRYGWYVTSASCNRTVIGRDNQYAGNRVAPYRNLGTATVFE